MNDLQVATFHTQDALDEYRHKCRTDLFFLARELGYTDIQEKPHREIAEFFLKKDYTQSFKKFAQADQSSHERLLLLPRGGFKSTLDAADTVQLIICWPDITILLLTGVRDLGLDFLKEIKSHFILSEDGKPKVNSEDQYSTFQIAFYEFCTADEGLKETFISPMRTVQHKEPTIMADGVEATLSGWHFDYCKADDTVTNENSHTKERIKKIKNQLALHHKMINPYGYCDKIGTWYTISDEYGETIAQEEKNGTLVWNRGKADSVHTDDREIITRILLRPAMSPKPGKDNVPEDLLQEQDWELWFPERITYKYLIRERAKNPEIFACQLQNNPRGLKRVKFTRDSLIKATRPYTQMPEKSVNGLLVQIWDTAVKANTWCDYSVGITALFYGGLVYILDIVRGQYNEFELPQVIANAVYKWKPSRLAIEDSNGVRWLIRQVYHEFQSLGVDGRYFEYVPIGNRKSADKSSKAGPFKRMLDSSRIVISNSIPKLDDVYDELEKFPDGEHDDLVDAFALLINHFGQAAEVISQPDIDTKTAANRLQYERIYGISKTVINTAPETPPERIPLYVAYDPLSEFS